MKLLADPLLYLNYLFAAIALYLIWKFGKQLKSDIENDDPIGALFKLALLSVAVGGCVYLSWEFGTISLEKMGIKV